LRFTHKEEEILLHRPIALILRQSFILYGV